jgi:hypothetical protein
MTISHLKFLIFGNAAITVGKLIPQFHKISKFKLVCKAVAIVKSVHEAS